MPQVFIAILLVLNFVANAYETQMYGKLRHPDGRWLRLCLPLADV